MIVKNISVYKEYLTSILIRFKIAFRNYANNTFENFQFQN